MPTFCLQRHSCRHISWLCGETNKINRSYLQVEIFNLPPKKDSSKVPEHPRRNMWKIPGSEKVVQDKQVCTSLTQAAASSEVLLTPASFNPEKGCPGEEQDVRPSGTIKVKLNQTLWNRLLGVFPPSPELGQHRLIGPFSSLISLIQKVYKINC